jgi:hypothetical protein
MLGVAAAAMFATSVGAATYNNTPPMSRVLLGVDQTIAINSIRADSCGAKPPSFKSVKSRLPKPKLGVLVDGGIGWRYSSGCNAWVRARAIVYKARKVGTESVLIGADETIVTVRP